MAGRSGQAQKEIARSGARCDAAKHYSLRTERTYCDWITRFIRFHGMRHPAEMREAEMSEFLTHLARSENVSAATQNRPGIGGRVRWITRGREVLGNHRGQS